VGSYRYQKWGTDLDVVVYLMEVTRTDDDWQEAELRDREWVSAAGVSGRMSNDDVLRIYESALARLDPRRASPGD
jgi:hypothetical protein